MRDYLRSPHGNDWASIFSRYTEELDDGSLIATRSDGDLAELYDVSRGTVRAARTRLKVKPITLRHA